MPDEVLSAGLFDRAAASISEHVARAWFFTCCVVLIVVWAPSLAFLGLDTWQLIINTVTTIITFLLVALLQNTQDRAMKAQTHKLDAALKALLFLLHHDDRADTDDLEAELQRMTGVTMESS